MIQNNRVLITGGAGFIGSHLSDALILRGDEVFVIDNFISGKKENIEHLFRNPKFYFENSNLLSKSTNDVFKMFRPQYVFHLAAIPSVQYSISNPIETHEANVQLTVKLLELSKKSKAKRFIFASSAAVYGNTEATPVFENSVLNPLSPYALEKKIRRRILCIIFKVI